MILKAIRSWRRKALLKSSCSWRLLLLKTRGPEATSSEAASSEAASSEAISPEAEDQLNLRNSRIQELCHGSKFIKGQQKISGILQRSFQRCLKACVCNLDESVDIVLLYELYNHLLHYSVLCPRYRTRKQLQNNSLPAKMFLHNGNGFQIGSS